MKKKLVVLSASAVLASHFLVGGEAFAIVSGEENPYKSKALSIMERSNSSSVSVNQYKNHLEDLIHRLTISGYEKYDEPEYAEAVKKYKQRFMAEMEAMNQFLKEEKQIENKAKNKRYMLNDALGLTHQRYKSIYEELIQNKKTFDEEIERASKILKELNLFNDDLQYEADIKINELENQILMLGQAFKNGHAVQNLYNKLDLTIGNLEKEREEKRPVNKRMLDRKVEDLETIIDEFFEEINLARPIMIPALTNENVNNTSIKLKLKEQAIQAKKDKNLRHPRALKQKEAEVKSQFSHSNVVKPSLNIMEVEAPQTENSQPQVYTETTTQTTMAVAPQGKHETTFEVMQGRHFNNPATLNEEKSNSVASVVANENTQLKSEQAETPVLQQVNSMSHQSEETTQTSVESETITESHVVDIDESTTFQKSGYLYGLSQSDTSGYTDREKRAIKRNHVREAEALVNQYVDTHRYQDRIAAQQKVNTLSEAHQNRLNKMINKAYNGQ